MTDTRVHGCRFLLQNCTWSSQRKAKLIADVSNFCAAEIGLVMVSVNSRTGVLYARKFDQNAKNYMARRTDTPKIKWLAYTYAEK